MVFAPRTHLNNELVVVVAAALVVAVAGLAAPNESPAGFGTDAADVAGVEDFAPRSFVLFPAMRMITYRV